MMSESTVASRGRKRSLTDSARKRNKKELNAKLNKSRVYVGEQFDRWNSLKDDLGLQTHAEVAKLLLDRVSEKDLSGIEEIDTCFIKKRPKFPTEDKYSSFLNPLELSCIDVSDEGCEDHLSDEDYEPSFNITLRQHHEEFHSLKVEGNSEDEDSDSEVEDEIDKPETDLGPGIIRNTNMDEIYLLTSDQPFIVYSRCLMKLLTINIPQKCKDCGSSEILLNQTVVGSALYLKWGCKNGHICQKWCSQPILNRRMHSGDLLIASAVLLSGNNFKKIELFANFLKMPLLSKCTFHKIQRTYLVPSVNEFWVNQQAEHIREFQGKDLILLGDGRMDSPGHCAQYCSYSFMEQTTKKILCIITMDKRMTQLKSTNLEKACFVKGMKYLKDAGLKIVELVTDAHVQIAALMKSDFPEIKHSFDIWHGTKNFGKKIISIGQEKDKKEILDWTKDIMNHYWYSAQITNTYEEFLGIWFGILHHVTNEHKWILPYSENGPNECQHGPLTTNRDKGWLKQGSPAHVALRTVVMDKRRLNKVPYYLNCRNTAELENFQNLILVYASKRFSYNPPTYRARNQLAALNHNGHCERQVKINKDGSTRYQRSFNKKSGIWSVHQVKEDKTFTYIPSIISTIVKKRLQDRVGMNRGAVLEVDDPRRLSSTLAPIPPPPTSQLVQEQKSRFKDLDKTIDYTWTEN